ncbi:MAG: glycosyltransferase family 2 protein [Bacteroidales bacterium]|nr:glycosyltransferase family 2 protein [Bacteroidales bacterium]
MTFPLVSIIVPCYNQAQYLSEALDSVMAQTYPNWECIVVNDGSLDNLDEIARVYCDKDSRIKYLKQNNQGVSIARNNGISHSQGEYILPLDGDDKIAPTYLEKAVRYFLTFPETKVVYSLTRFFGGSNELYQLPTYEYEKMLWQGLIVCTAMIKRIDFEKTSGYNPNMREGLEDWDFWLSFLKKNDVVHRIDEVLFFYRRKNDSRTSESMIHLKELYVQLYNNHKELYDDYLNEIIYKQYLIDNTEARIKQAIYDKELEIRNSMPYRIGAFLLKPVKLFNRKFVNKIE